MAWPFVSVLQPSLDTGPGVTVPAVAAAVTLLPVWLLGAHFTNTGASARTVTVTTTLGAILCQLEIPPGAEQSYEWAFRPALGVKWSASGAGVIGQVWGYT